MCNLLDDSSQNQVLIVANSVYIRSCVHFKIVAFKTLWYGWWRYGSSKDVGSSFTSFISDVECYEVEKSQVGMRGGMEVQRMWIQASLHSSVMLNAMRWKSHKLE